MEQSSSVQNNVAKPVAAAERIQTLDVLRGFALLGILIVNMPIFINPMQYALVSHNNTEMVNIAAEWLIRFLAEGKFFSLFSFLFGLGFTIQMARAEAKGIAFIPRHLRRLGVLMLFGLAHGILIWVGDILFYYSVLGVLLIFFRHMKLRWVWVWLVIMLLLPLLFTLLGAVSLQFAASDPAIQQEVDRQMAAQMDGIRADMVRSSEIYAQGNFLEITRHRVDDLLYMWTISLFLAPTIFAMFLLGSIFGRKQYIHNAEQHTKLFRNLFIWGGIIGLIGNGIYATLIMGSNRFTLDWQMTLATAGQTVGAPLLMLAYVSAITLGMLNPTWRPRLMILAPVGRMALTNYLLQSIICTTIFYGYGFGLFGTVGTAMGLLLSFVIYALQIPWSHWWMARFHFGPAEWLWRTLTYGKVQPFRL